MAAQEQDTGGKKPQEYFIGGTPGPILGEIRRIEHHAKHFLNLWTSRFAQKCYEAHGLNLEGRTVLFLGVGPGAALPPWLQFNPGKIIGLDTSEEMLQRAEERAQELGVGDRFEPLVGRVQDLGGLVSPASVDVVIARQLWHFVPIDMQIETMKRVREVLKPSEVFRSGVLFEELVLVDEQKSWRLEPPLKANDDVIVMLEALYKRMGADMNMGNRLSSLCQEAGLEIIEERKDSITSKEEPEVITAHPWLLESAGQGMRRVGIIAEEGTEGALMTPEEFEAKIAEIRAFLKTGAVVHSPIMRQVYAVVP